MNRRKFLVLMGLTTVAAATPGKDLVSSEQEINIPPTYHYSSAQQDSRFVMALEVTFLAKVFDKKAAVLDMGMCNPEDVVIDGYTYKRGQLRYMACNGHFNYSLHLWELTYVFHAVPGTGHSPIYGYASKNLKQNIRNIENESTNRW